MLRCLRPTSPSSPSPLWYGAIALVLAGCVVVPNEDYAETDAADTDDPDVDTDTGTGDGPGMHDDGPGMNDDGPGKGDGLTCGEAATDPSPAGPCPAACDSCQGATCIVDCAGKHACKNESLWCPPDMHCEFRCNGEHACEDTTFLCNDAGVCDVTCNGKEACKKARTECGNGPCVLDCGVGDEPCKDAELRCGMNVGEILCNGHQPGVRIDDSRAGDCACEVGDWCQGPGGHDD